MDQNVKVTPSEKVPEAANAPKVQEAKKNVRKNVEITRPHIIRQNGTFQPSSPDEDRKTVRRLPESKVRFPNNNVESMTECRSTV